MLLPGPSLRGKSSSCTVNPPRARQIRPLRGKSSSKRQARRSRRLGSAEHPPCDRWLIRSGNQRRQARCPERSPRGRGRTNLGPPLLVPEGRCSREKKQRAKRGQTLLIWSCWKRRSVHNGCNHPTPKSHDPLQRPLLPRLDPIYPGRGIERVHRPRMTPKKGFICSPCAKTPSSCGAAWVQLPHVGLQQAIQLQGHIHIHIYI